MVLFFRFLALHTQERKEYTMLKIGDFAKVSRVSVKTLRYYDEIGLLRPSQIDRFTGYSYYTLDQLPRLNRILALKDLGLSLDQIALLLDQGMPADHIRGMLRLKQAELRQIVEEERARLERVEARLRQIEQEGRLPDYDVIIKRVESIRVASIRDVAPNLEVIGEVLSPLYMRLWSYLTEHNAVCSGPSLTLYHEMEAGKITDLQVEAAIPVQGSLATAGEISVSDLPTVEQMACVVHSGPFDEFEGAYRVLLGWIETGGYTIVGPSREVYLHFEPGADPSSFVTEIQIPVNK